MLITFPGERKTMWCIHNARLILSDRIVDRGWLLIADQLIQAIGQDVPPDVPDRLDADGSYVAPGFVDLHVQDRKSTRLNSSHQIISYAVFCLKKKKRNTLTLSSNAITLAYLRSVYWSSRRRRTTP